MKTKFLLILLILAYMKLPGQNFFVIDFEGNPDSVYVENLTQGINLNMQGTDVLHLRLSGTSIMETDHKTQLLSIYPNPMDQSCNFHFENTGKGMVFIHLYRANGGLVYEYSNMLPRGLQQFKLSGLSAGFYLLNIKTENYQVTGKLVSQNRYNGDIVLIHINETSSKIEDDINIGMSNPNSNHSVPLKFRNIVELDFAIGDQLKFEGLLSGFDNDVIFASPVSDLSITFNFCKKPAQPSLIIGAEDPCEGASESYSVTNETDVKYVWSIPDGWIILEGQFTSNITVTVGNLPGNIRVTPSNDCGNGPERTLSVISKIVPEQPSAINGNANPCQGISKVYSVPDIHDVTYTWDIPSGWILTSGQNTNSITVTTGAGSGTISVTPSNECGEGITQTLSVSSQFLPDQPSFISGVINPCQGSTEEYSVVSVPNVTYTWGVPPGWTVVSGQSTGKIKVIVGGGSGNIFVIPSNDCGSGIAQIINVLPRSLPMQPSAISGNKNPCYGAIESYSVDNVSGVAYTWQLPSDWTLISGQTTNSITVLVGNAQGYISVLPSNDCGSGPGSSTVVSSQTVPVQPIAGDHTISETQIGWNWNIVSNASGYKYNTVNNYNTATEYGTSTSYLQAGLICNTTYTLYVWAYNNCGVSTPLLIVQNTDNCTFICGTSTVTFNYTGTSVNYGTVLSANNKCWLDRNLGASRVATSSTDASSYGHLFQWGRLDDGHQVRNSLNMGTLSNSDVPGHGNFIFVGLFDPYDWRSPQNSNLWQGANGINNPCPFGFRLPSIQEWDVERANWNSNNADGAFAFIIENSHCGQTGQF